MKRLNQLRRHHGKCRADLLTLLWMEKAPANLQRSLQDVLTENRILEEYISRSADAVMDARHTARMIELAEASNSIAGNANATAHALKVWTVVLAIATVVLALATLALIWATLRTG